MNDNFHTIFSESGCPDHEQLLAYFRNRLPEDERHRIERHLVDCPMCSDELEGLSLMEHPERLDEIVDEIKAGIGERKPRVVRMNFRVFAMAAAAVLVLAIGTVMTIRLLTKENAPPLPAPAMESIAMEQKQKALSSPPPSAAETREAVKKIKTETRAPAREENPSGPAGKEEADELAALPVLADSVALSGKDTLHAVSNQPAAGYIISEMAVEDKQAAAGKKSSGTRALPKSPGEDLMKTAMDLFNSRKYLQASGLFERILKDQPDNYKAIYYSAYSYYHLKDTIKASRTLEKILADPENEYYRAAKSLSKKVKTRIDSL